LIEEGVSIRCNNLPALAYKIDKLISDSNRFKTMQNNCYRLARPDAAQQIAKELIESDSGTAVYPAGHKCVKKLNFRSRN